MNYPGYLDSIVKESGLSAMLRSLLFDGVTGLPTVPLVLQSIKDTAAEHRRLGIVFIHTDSLEEMELQYGWELVDGLLSQIPGYLDTIASEFDPLKLLSIQRLPGDNILLLVYSPDSDQPVNHEKVSHVSSYLDEHLGEYLAKRVAPSILPFVRIFTGHSILEYHSDVRFERLLSRAINRAYVAAVSEEEKVSRDQLGQLQDLINGGEIRTFFQPILSLHNNADILGYEALSRGPEGTFFDKTDFMFSLAANHGLLPGLESLCQRSLLSTIQDSVAPRTLFVNLEPHFLEQERYNDLPLFTDSSVNPEHVVIEITERVAITDYATVAQAMESIRRRGFRIAVDDVGSGYASLQSIAYLKPEFIKVNDKMVQGIAGDYIKQEIVKTLRDMANRFSAVLIAEGIETEEDLISLKNLQVPYGQGFLLKAPSDAL